MPKVMAAMPNIGGAVCSIPESAADAKAKFVKFGKVPKMKW